MLNHALTLLMGVSRDRVPAGFVYAPDAAYAPPTLRQDLEAARAVWVPVSAWLGSSAALYGLMAGIVARLHCGRFDAFARLADARTSYDGYRHAADGAGATATVEVTDPSGTLSVRVDGGAAPSLEGDTVVIRGVGQTISMAHAATGAAGRATLSFVSGVSAPVRLGGTGYTAVFVTAQEEYPSTAVTTVRIHPQGHAALAERVRRAVGAYRKGRLITEGAPDPVDDVLDEVCAGHGVYAYREAALALLTARAIDKVR